LPTKLSAVPSFKPGCKTDDAPSARATDAFENAATTANVKHNKKRRRKIILDRKKRYRFRVRANVGDFRPFATSSSA
jgi:hypothetical protein